MSRRHTVMQLCLVGATAEGGPVAGRGTVRLDTAALQRLLADLWRLHSRRCASRRVWGKRTSKR